MSVLYYYYTGAFQKSAKYNAPEFSQVQLYVLYMIALEEISELGQLIINEMKTAFSGPNIICQPCIYAHHGKYI